MIMMIEPEVWKIMIITDHTLMIIIIDGVVTILATSGVWALKARKLQESLVAAPIEIIVHVHVERCWKESGSTTCPVVVVVVVVCVVIGVVFCSSCFIVGLFFLASSLSHVLKYLLQSSLVTD
ncbi:hypothetical protein PanWU01x14_041310 [Parasponia andersonii]|uniref:Transmembrane protein n=1 Tax=Parasponia andersonii TaxID=3476 RepID=A0A2P5DQF2_PARAD|nr:hypothetical protein PanWU01x14_041310 [Parasponia andersonii]